MPDVEPRCPQCRALLDANRNLLLGREAQSGDFTLCAYCGELLVFDPPPQIRRPTLDEAKDMTPAQHQLIKRTQAILRGPDSPFRDTAQGQRV